MEIVGLFTAVMMILMALALTLLAVATKGWRKTIPGAGALILVAGAIVLGVMTVKLSYPAPAPDAVVEKDFYQVIWEEKTVSGKTLVVVKDSAGEFYFSEFDEPLGVKRVLVVEKDRFKPFLPAEKPEQLKPQK
ncbi:MAG: hypothetical protein A2812_01890 [Candidatus Staskawiczbacteria bacterium RIFCSPHIGHO2_01_FULL_36_16]|uniref:Uncharacterized protein n=1 Tax=Candidatus Staskawiczbacteria bacterium RIFCSPHIGHO2_01_FULL_36_16 TaxID=1802200 RepID=A0A1G2HSY0_9BACT|nr:MAG: hypothetical protein A2812_01890 [Candidatus Staskawiczbacteria bacterium RIFCSPHIGHO2_01_FULL_36_16]